MINVLDRYKYGLLAAFATYMFIYMYLIMATHEIIPPYEDITFNKPRIVEEDVFEEIELMPENIEMTGDMAEDYRNVVKDRNDKRETSMTDWSYPLTENEKKTVAQFEKDLLNSTGGDMTREEIRAKALEELEKLKQSGDQGQNTPSNSGGDKAFAGKALVEFDLDNRDPFQNNRWWVRNPGYTCGHWSGKGIVQVQIKVGQDGHVSNATVLSATNANSCMKERAVEYAYKSRFTYSSSAPKIQTGTITYTFVPQH